jgi:hypothetical protein
MARAQSESYPGNPVNPPRRPGSPQGSGSVANLMQGNGAIPFGKCVGCGRAVSASEGPMCVVCERTEHYYSEQEAFDNYDDQQPFANRRRRAY